MEALGPKPLLRQGPDGQLELRQEGLELLRRVGAPVHVAFAIGGSRCGKSTAGNALIFGAEAGDDGGFETGGSFDPVTTGVDVAARPLPGGGALIVGDCEGAFHLCGSSRSARGFGLLGLVAYHLSTALLHVSMGSIDERDVEVLGHLATSAALPGTSGAAHREARLGVSAAPSLVLLVNGARFDMGDAVARRLLRPPGAGDPDAARGSARTAIERGFRGQPALEALPACEHAAYWPKVDALRRRILETSPMVMSSGLQATGADVADRVAELVAALGGGEAQGGPAASLAREPESATEALYRAEHLEPLVEEISRRFAAAGAGDEAGSGTPSSKSNSPSHRAVEEALAEFDRRAAWLVDGPGDDGGAAPVREGLVKDVRSRLAARLAGINEALARGRQQGALRRPRGLEIGVGKENHASTSLGTSSRNSTEPNTPTKKTMSTLEAAIAEVDRRLEHAHTQAVDEVARVQASFSTAQQHVAQMAEKAVEAERQAAAAVGSLQEHWNGRLREVAEDRARAMGAQATRSNATISQLQSELREIEEQLPDVGLCSLQLNELRDGLEEERLRRCAAADAATRSIEDRLQSLREALEEEGGSLLHLRESIGHRLSQHVEELRAELQEERQAREDRHTAMSQVVDRLRVSLEASVEAAEVGEPPPQHPRAPRYAATTPTPAPPPAPPSAPSSAARWARGAGLATPESTASRGSARRVGDGTREDVAAERVPRPRLGGGALAMAALAGETLHETRPRRTGLLSEALSPKASEYMV